MFLVSGPRLSNENDFRNHGRWAIPRNLGAGSVFLRVDPPRNDRQPMPAVFAFLKPFAVLAALVLRGRLLRLSRGGRTPSQAMAQTDLQAAATSGPASADWNLPKHI